MYVCIYIAGLIQLRLQNVYIGREGGGRGGGGEGGADMNVCNSMMQHSSTNLSYSTAWGEGRVLGLKCMYCTIQEIWTDVCFWNVKYSDCVCTYLPWWLLSL